MWRFPKFSVAFLVLLMTTRPWSDPQADPDPPYKPEINLENPQLQEIFRMMKAMHTEIKTLRRSFSQLSELKTVARRVSDLEARLAANDVEELASRQNETTVAVEELASSQSETAALQQERFADFCRTRRMGMSTRVIPDDSITSATPYDHRFVAANGRFGTNRSWLARSMNMDAVWLKVDLGRESRVYGVITQGRPDYGQWARTYKLSFSTDGGNWTTYADTDGSDKGNYDRSSPVYNFLDSPVTTRHVQFHPRTYQSRPVMRVEVLGCPTELL